MKAATFQFIKIFFLSFVLFSVSTFAQKDYNKIKRKAVNGLQQKTGSVQSVEQAMKTGGLKGLSVAVFEDYRIVWTETWGIKGVDDQQDIDEETAFSTASIAKPVTATLLAILEEKGLIDGDHLRPRQISDRS